MVRPAVCDVSVTTLNMCCKMSEIDRKIDMYVYENQNEKFILKLYYLCSRSGRKIGRPRGFQRHFAIAGIGYSVPCRRPIGEKMEISIYHFQKFSGI